MQPTSSIYFIAVRALCEFAAKRGDLDLRFTPSPSAQEGIAGHALVARRRQAPYQSEVSLTGRYQHLEVRGRADGYDPNLNQLEEVKTYRGYIENIAGNQKALHWSQAKVYAWLMCQELALSEMNVALVYFSIDTEEETVIVEHYLVDELRIHFEALCSVFLTWSEKELVHQELHRNFANDIIFPFEKLYSGQRVLAESVFKAATLGRGLIAQAPTGIGKTIGTLFPALKSGAKNTIQPHKIFYLAAKTSGRAMALSAVQILSNQTNGKGLRALELIAKEKACEHLDKACHGDSCPLAKGFYDKLPAARDAAVKQTLLTKEITREVALKYQVCPYYLSQEMVRWADVVVCDYNYYFDLNAMLYALTVSNQWKVHLLVDEAHNLPDRARAMYGAELSESSIRALVQEMPDSLKKDVDRFRRIWRKLFKEQSETIAILAEAPDKLLIALEKLLASISALLADDTLNHAIENPAMQAFFLEGLHFQKVLALFDKHFFIEANTEQANAQTKELRLRIHNVLPAPMLRPRFEAAHSTTLFSATLNPTDAYKALLGLPDDSVEIDVASPFSKEQLGVTITPNISTRFKDRDKSLGLLIETIADQYKKQPGNYLAFFSSFDYLQKAVTEIEANYPDVPCWVQSRAMNENDRERFIERFTPTSSGIGFAVLGGAFSEGIDLPGTRLIGAFVATLGLPQFNRINDEMRQRMDDLLGNGYEYIYLYPGLQKVVQAAGRVIRTKDDQGVVYLMDDRFTGAQVKALLPHWWGLT
jgi:DNA excision repair protein ERCC-2